MRRVALGWVYGETMTPDVAIVKTARVIEFGDRIAPLCIPMSHDQAPKNTCNQSYFEDNLYVL